MSVKQLTTAEDLWNMPEVPGRQFELVNGVLVEMPGAGGLHGLIAALLVRGLGSFVDEARLGLVFTDATSYILRREPDLVRIPDASFVSWARIPPEGVPEGFISGAPDLAIEIVSPGDSAQDVYDKVHQYLDAGTLMVWVLWPRYQAVTLYRIDGSVQELSGADFLEGDDVLPGFRIPVSTLFDLPTRP